MILSPDQFTILNERLQPGTFLAWLSGNYPQIIHRGGGEFNEKITEKFLRIRLILGDLINEKEYEISATSTTDLDPTMVFMTVREVETVKMIYTRVISYDDYKNYELSHFRLLLDWIVVDQFQGMFVLKQGENL